MNVLLIGSGAREHAIAWKLRQSSQVDDLFAAPGNGGISELGANLPVSATDVEAMVEVARQRRIDLTLVGPEMALAAGVVDAFKAAGLDIFGPSKAAAEIESSKAFAKELMQRCGVPCAQSVTFDSYKEASRFLERRGEPIVVKADGLAAGKGVFVAQTRQEALAALDACMKEQAFGDAGARVVIEEFMEGREVSVFAFTDGETISPLVAACDYKRAFDGDLGPNTGGMGAYSPPEFWSADLAEEVLDTIFRPTLSALAQQGRNYRGVLYGGLMLTRSGVKVVEFNARFGDPEAQVLLPRLESDLVEVAQAVAQGGLSKAEVRWSDDACVGVVVASKGYPGSYETGYPLEGLEEAASQGFVFHAGTKLAGDALVTSGGRVLTAVGCASTLSEARKRAYAAVERVRFQNAYYRRDIAMGAIALV